MIAVCRLVSAVQDSPQSGQFPSGYVATSSGVSTKLSQLWHCIVSTDDEGLHLDPLLIVRIVSLMSLSPLLFLPHLLPQNHEHAVYQLMLS